MKKNFTLASILLTGIIFQTGCANKTTPIIPIIPTPKNNTQTYSTPIEPISQNREMVSNHIPEQIEPTHTYVNNTPIQYEESVELIPQRIEPIIEEMPIEESFNTYPSQVETQAINTPIMQENTPSIQSSGGAGYQIQTIQGQSIAVKEQSTGLIFPQYQGKVILLQIFGKNCEFCFKEMPIIQKIQQKYRGKLQIIAIQGQERMSRSTASRLIGKYNMNYPIIERDDAGEILSYIGDNYGWTGVLPFIQIIKDGSTEATFGDGGASYGELSEIIGSL